MQKNFPQGRIQPGDQATLTVDNDQTAPFAGTGVTTGTNSGIQRDDAEKAGPVLGLVGETYYIAESGAGASAAYGREWECVDTANRNEVIASGTGPSGSFELTAPAGGGSRSVLCTFTNTPSSPDISLDKQAGEIADLDSNGPDAGDTITYSFDVTNTGEVDLETVTVADPKVGAVTCPSGGQPLEVGQTLRCTAEPYVLTQADVDNREVVNTATATGTATGYPNVTDTDSTTTPVIPVEPDPAIAMVKSHEDPVDVDENGIDADDTVQYSFEVTNTGNVALDPVTVTDPKVGAVTCPTGALAPDESVTCTADAAYELTQADLDAGEVVNTATASGTPPTGDPVTAEDDDELPLEQSTSIELDKVAGTIVDANGNERVDAGDTIEYTFEVTNTGTVTLDPVTVSDPKVGEVTCPSSALVPGDSVDCDPVTYTLTQVDVDSGSVNNNAVATGTPPGDLEPPEGPDSTTTPVQAGPAIAMVKSHAAPVNANSSGRVDAGDTVQYSFEVTNTGNVTLDPVTVTDDLVGAVTCDPSVLAPGAAVTCTADAVYELTQADVDAGEVVNTATASGLPPTGDPVTAEDDDELPLEQATGIELDKVAGDIVDANGNERVDAGDTIEYTFEVTNTGNVSLDPVTVEDPKVGEVTCPNEEPLLPGDSMECVAGAAYELTALDLTSGSVDNRAVARGTPPGDLEPPEGPDTTTTPTEPAPKLELDKVATVGTDQDNDGDVEIGDEIDFTFEVTNTGDVELTDVTVEDDMVLNVVCDQTTLAPEESTICTADPYVVTAADVAAGSVDNVAVAVGSTPDGDDVTSPEDDTSTPVVENPGTPGSPAPPRGIPSGPGPTSTGWLPNTGGVGSATSSEVWCWPCSAVG